MWAEPARRLDPLLVHAREKVPTRLVRSRLQRGKPIAASGEAPEIAAEDVQRSPVLSKQWPDDDRPRGA